MILHGRELFFDFIGIADQLPEAAEHPGEAKAQNACAQANPGDGRCSVITRCQVTKPKDDTEKQLNPAKDFRENLNFFCQRCST